MAFNERVAERLRGLFDAVPVTEKRMFGGVAFMVRGNMCAGVVGSDLMPRVARPMDFTGKPMKGYRRWLERGLSSVATLPAK